ncbi:hypothetical protein [Intestinimonas sp. HCP28S3_D6]|uniref:hypothetical protein n=1 Tax=Intestinimonas sp. HCP28S3_D6 TaxID=3438942 RepID=UPI003F89552C
MTGGLHAALCVVLQIPFLGGALHLLFRLKFPPEAAALVASDTVHGTGVLTGKHILTTPIRMMLCPFLGTVYALDLVPTTMSV